MKKILLVSVAVAATGFGCAHSGDVSTTTAQTPQAKNRTLASTNTQACVREASDDGCDFYYLDVQNAGTYAAECRPLYSGSGKTKYIVFRMTDGDIVAVKSVDPKRKPENHACPVTRFKTGLFDSGDKTYDITTLGYRMFFVTDNGHLYMGTLNRASELEFAEILSSNGHSFSSPAPEEKQLPKEKRNHFEETAAYDYKLGAYRNVDVIFAQGKDKTIHLTESFIKKRRDRGHLQGARPDYVQHYKSGETLSIFSGH
jgi:hypothetical protein